MIELATARLTLRGFRPGDVDDALAYRDDAEFARYLPHVPQPFTRDHAEEFVAINISDPHTWGVVIDGRVIGTANLEVDGAIAMLGYAIARAHWGRGIALEASRALLDWAFPALALDRVWASTDARNVRSRRVLEKLGMQLEGCLRRHGRAREGVTDEVCYGLLREDWRR